MNRLNKCGVLLLGVLLALSLSACTIPMPGFVEYDVSGYIQALLDSSYHDSHEEFIAVTKSASETAKANNTTTVENAAVNFCNTYGLSPSDSQMQELQKILRQAFALTKYTVKDEQKVDTGYYLEVEVTSIINFSGRQADIEKLKTQAQEEATAANTDVPSSFSGDGEDSSETEYDEYGNPIEGEEESEPSSQAGASGSGAEYVDANSLFVDKVLQFCTRELANITYDQESRTIALDIRQTDQGELQLDMNQIDTIDQTVLRFSK